MPWLPSYTNDDLRLAIEGAENWIEVMAVLGLGYHGKTIARARRWAAEWGIVTDHLTDKRGRAGASSRYSDADLREAVAAARSWAETLRTLGLCPTGGNAPTLKKRCVDLGISTEHFDPHAHARRRGALRRTPLDEVLVERSSYSRSNLKFRLYEAGLKHRRCELCGLGEEWNGMRIGLILDHINGVRNDNRLENLRIVCPNCAAGLDTHCGRKNKRSPSLRPCDVCGREYQVKYPDHRFCSVQCGAKGRLNLRGVAHVQRRKVERPSLAQLQEDLAHMSFCAVGRKYGVSDNAIRRWLVFYERQAERERREAA